MRRQNLNDLLWMAAGAVIVLAIMGVSLYLRKEQNPAAQIAFKARRIELVEQMRRDLASASEAEKSAVMATSDESSRDFADQARAGTAAVEQSRKELEGLLQTGRDKNERDLLVQFSRDFGDFQRVDSNVLNLAVQNTNLKAFSLTFGPATDAINEMDAALSRIAADSARSDAETAKPATQLAGDARIRSLRLLALLPPHIVEEADQKMDEIEARMTAEDSQIRKDLDELATLLKSSESPDLETASSRYANFSDLRSQIIKLSRENTNVRSLSISLNQKRRVMLVCQDDLAALEQAIRQEPIPGENTTAPASPR
jgi:hypothetical protein